MRHETPVQVAKLLIRYAPRNVRSVLDPAAGSGVLARPFFHRKGCRRIELLDIDRSAVAELRSNAPSTGSVAVSNKNFLHWFSGPGHRKRFDCVVMNPPFAAKLRDYVPIRVPGADKDKRVAVEAAFVYLASRLLRPHGRLLAILPPSIVSGDGNAWLRGFLMEYGNIRLVHELPRLTFAGVEGPTYLFVFERGENQGDVLSRNHRLFDPEELRINRTEVRDARRLDFRFHEAHAWFRMITHQKIFGWVPLQSVATVLRGAVDSPITSKSVLHTTNISAFKSRRKQSRADGDLDRSARYGDIILKRVGRNAALSAILYTGKYPARCSDCILILRPRVNTDMLRLLFGLRTLIAWRRGAGLVEHGVGATYISARRLRSLCIPKNLAELYPGSFRRFSTLVNNAEWGNLSSIEDRVRKRMVTRVANNVS